MTTLEWCLRLGIGTTRRQRMAMRILERQGLRFLIDFGTDNAIDMCGWKP